MREDGVDDTFAAKLGLAGVGLFLGLPTLGWFSWLREMPIFWRNEGGYPVWLRDLVLGAYYPVFAGNLLVVLLLYLLLLISPPRTKLSLWSQITFLVLMSGIIFGTGLYVVWDNVFDL